MIALSVCIPTTGLCRSENALSMVNFSLYFMQNPIFVGQQQSIVFRHYQSSSISNGRETLVMNSLADGATHVLFIDEDMAFDADTVHVMMRKQWPLLCCNYKIRFEGMPFTAIDPAFKFRIGTTIDSPDTEPCGACGFGLSLIAREVFESMPQPWFPTYWDEVSKTYSTEDVPFFTAAKAAGFSPIIDHEASRKVIHVGSYRYRWNDPRG